MTTLGRYELGRPLGDGGRCWEAELVGPAGFRKRVAVRLLDGADDALLGRVREQGALRHPNLVEVYEVDEVDARWYCAMELVRGGALEALGPLSPRALVDLGVQLCAALAARRAGGSRAGALQARQILFEEGVVKLEVDFDVDAVSVDSEGDVRAIGAVLAQLGATGGVGPLSELVADCAAGIPSTIDALATRLEALEAAGPGLAELGASGEIAGVDGWQTAARTNLGDLAAGVGRAELSRELVTRLTSARLVTVKGPPGAGKSHLLRAAARARLDAGVAEVWWVTPGERYLAQAVADELGLPSAEDVSAALAERGEVLLVVDPMDGHLSEAAQLVGWLGAAPALRVAVASREPLRLPGEQLVEVGPLTPEEARELLVRRAGRAIPDAARWLQASGGLAASVAALGDHLAASGAGDPEGLALDAISEELARLGRGLAPWERAALAQLATLSGNFSLEQAELTIDLDGFPSAPWALDVVASLVDRSLLCSQPGTDPPTFQIPAPIRAWADTRATGRAS